MHLRVTLLPDPESPMITVFCPSGTSRESPSSTRFTPKDLVRFSRRITGKVGKGGKDGKDGKVEQLPRAGAMPSWATFPPFPSFPSFPSSQQHQRPEGVQHQDRLAAEHDGAGGGLPHALGAAFRVEAAQASHEGHRAAEAGALQQAEPDVL